MGSINAKDSQERDGSFSRDDVPRTQSGIEQRDDDGSRGRRSTDDIADTAGDGREGGGGDGSGGGTGDGGGGRRTETDTGGHAARHAGDAAGGAGHGAGAGAGGGAHAGAGVGGGGGGGSDGSDGEPETPSLIPTVFRWEHGGHSVYLSGTFNEWSKKIPMHRSGNDFTYILNLPRGKHAFKYIVDNEWRFAPDQPIVRDAAGNVNNFVDLSEFDPLEDVTLVKNATVAAHLNYGRDVPDVSEYTTEPPPLPPHLRYLVLNTPAHPRDPSLLPTPQHVSLNHLFCTAIRDGLMVQGVSQRYRQKFVTTVYYSLMPLSNSAARIAGGGGPESPAGPVGASAPGASSASLGGFGGAIAAGRAALAEGGGGPMGSPGAGAGAGAGGAVGGPPLAFGGGAAAAPAGGAARGDGGMDAQTTEGPA